MALNNAHYLLNLQLKKSTKEPTNENHQAQQHQLLNAVPTDAPIRNPDATHARRHMVISSSEMTLMPLMPESIIDRFSAVMTPRMMQAEEQASLIHPDRFDMIVDWGCVAHRIVRTKVSK